MKKSPSFQFYPQDFLSGVKRFTTEETGAYILLLIEQWDSGFVEKNEKFLKKITGISSKKLEKVLEKFEEKEGKFFNKKLEQVRQEQIDFRAKKSISGQLGNKKRWSANHETIAEKSHSDENAIEKSIENDIAKNRSSSSSSSSIVNKESSINYETESHPPPDWILKNEMAKDLENKLCKYFAISEISNFQSFAKIRRFLFELNNHGKLQHFENQLINYIKFKEIDKSYPHSLDKFLGWNGQKFENGKWNECDWALRIKALNKNLKVEKFSATKAISRNFYDGKKDIF